MGEYANIKLVKATAVRFRSYAQKLAPTQSEALEALIDSHLRLPRNTGDRSKSVQLLADRSDMNTNRVIGLIRKIEKEQIGQMLGMLKVLFGYSSDMGGTNSKKQPSKFKAKVKDTKFDEAFDFLKIKEEKLKLAADLEMARREIHELLSKRTEQVRPVYGKPYIKLLVPSEELRRLITRYTPHK